MWTLNQSHWILSCSQGSPSIRKWLSKGSSRQGGGRWAGVKAGWLVVLLGREACERPRIDKPPPKPLSSLALWDEWDASRVGLREPDGASPRVYAFQAKHAKDPSADGHSTPGCWVRSGIPMPKHSLKSRSYQKIPWNFAQTGLKCQLVYLYFIMIITS